MFLENIPAILLLVGNVLTAIFGYAVATVQRRGTADVARVSSSGPDWHNFTGKMEDFFENRFQEQDRRIEGLTNEVKRLDAEVVALRSEKKEIDAKYSTSLAYIGLLWVRDEKIPQEVPPPVEIERDLQPHIPP